MSSTHGDRSAKGRSLAESIRAATRPIHTQLNKLIVSRLPHSLPPRAEDPSAYVTGLLHIAAIYSTFESLWQEILTHGPHCPEPPQDEAAERSVKDARHVSATADINAVEPRGPHVSSRVHTILSVLHVPGLLRAGRIRRDIEALTGWSRDTVEMQIVDIGSRGSLGDFLKHINSSIEDRPHILIAYSYILYMALFAGGRFIRASLESAGEDFWSQIPSPVLPNMVPCTRPGGGGCTSLRCTLGANQVSTSSSSSAGSKSKASKKKPWCRTCQSQPQDTEYERSKTHKQELRYQSYESQHLDANDISCPSRRHSNTHVSLHFFHFPTPEDGEDLKREFKDSLLSIQDQLLPREKLEIVDEGVAIFEQMLMVVEQLDQVCNRTPLTSDSDATSVKDSAPEGLLGPDNLLHVGRVRDSVVVTKERSARKSRAEGTSKLGVGFESSEEADNLDRTIRFKRKLKDTAEEGRKEKVRGWKNIRASNADASGHGGSRPSCWCP